MYYGYYSYCYIMFLNKETKKFIQIINYYYLLPIAINYYQLSSFDNTSYYRNYHTKLKSIIYSK